MILDIVGLLLGALIIGLLAVLLTPTVVGVVWLTRRFSKQPHRTSCGQCRVLHVNRRRKEGPQL